MTQPSSTSAATAAPTPNPNPLYNPALPADPNLLQQTLLPAPSATALCTPHIPSPSTLPTLTLPPGAPPPNPNNVLLVIPTANASKTALLTNLLTTTRPPHVAALTARQIPADSGVGEQPYDAAGPQGAFNRVVAAVRALQADAAHRAALVEGRVGTVIVGAVENFIVRPGVEVGSSCEEEGEVPVDYGVVVLCRISVGGEGEEVVPWEWRVGVSRGVTVPVEYWRAAEGFGFEDEARTHGKVTVGEVIAANVAGVDKADWFKPLTGVSRYDLLGDAMKEMEVPWPVVTDAPAAVV
ncbi:hypothetical protein B0I37DRAFT_19465 [Chaetomium sp. MPI-CAGE-AT-0009]|nr:hypothetical protein B0I37DRAFT_19465 [Chaetomium sp. MPI-CAGE-AT-0009]